MSFEQPGAAPAASQRKAPRPNRQYTAAPAASRNGQPSFLIHGANPRISPAAIHPSRKWPFDRVSAGRTWMHLA